MTDRGVNGTTIEAIAAAAHIARSTFFRYFDTKEIAVAEGFTTPWLSLIVEALENQPPELTPIEAVLSAFAHFAQVLHDDPDVILRQAQLSQASPGLQAWTLHLFARGERAIAATVTGRFHDLQDQDPRPLMVGVVAMAAVRNSLARWLESDAQLDLAALIRESLLCIDVRSPYAQHDARGRDPVLRISKVVAL